MTLAEFHIAIREVLRSSSSFLDFVATVSANESGSRLAHGQPIIDVEWRIYVPRGEPGDALYYTGRDPAALLDALRVKLAATRRTDPLPPPLDDVGAPPEPTP
jgi:hypothetical protein